MFKLKTRSAIGLLTLLVSVEQAKVLAQKLKDCGELQEIHPPLEAKLCEPLCPLWLKIRGLLPLTPS
ncbi:MAG TPA: hypothetical protein VK956_16410, partial [Verrucomicrobium sp.]|nr:hypothetical protein [Verrucomicrobium sp.]